MPEPVHADGCFGDLGCGTCALIRERDEAVKMRSNACAAVAIAEERIAELEKERDEARALLVRYADALAWVGEGRRR